MLSALVALARLRFVASAFHGVCFVREGQSSGGLDTTRPSLASEVMRDLLLDAFAQ